MVLLPAGEKVAPEVDLEVAWGALPLERGLLGGEGNLGSLSGSRCDFCISIEWVGSGWVGHGPWKVQMPRGVGQGNLGGVLGQGTLHSEVARPAVS